jgi:hypothetical protein
MKTRIFAALLLLTPSLQGQSAPSPSDSVDYEELPELKASEILREDILAGPHHKVREEVPTYSGANRFTIDSDFGAFEANTK